MKTWSTKQEAENLFKRFTGINKAKFAREYKVPGGPSMISQHCSGHRAIGLESAIIYAKGLGCSLADISARLDAEIKKASGEVIESKQKKEVAQFNIKDFAKYTDKLNEAERAQLDYLLAHFVVLAEKHKKLVITLIDTFYETDTAMKLMTRMRAAPDSIKGTDNERRISSKKA
jgi:hypothetical protein